MASFYHVKTKEPNKLYRKIPRERFSLRQRTKISMTASRLNVSDSAALNLMMHAYVDIQERQPAVNVFTNRLTSN